MCGRVEREVSDIRNSTRNDKIMILFHVNMMCFGGFLCLYMYRFDFAYVVVVSMYGRVRCMCGRERERTYTRVRRIFWLLLVGGQISLLAGLVHQKGDQYSM